jgi:hypothetical protein
MMNKFDPEKTVDLVWTKDSETGEKVLIDRKTNVEVGRWRKTLTCPLCGKEK